MNGITFRGHANQLKGTFQLGMGRLTGSGVGRVRGRMLRMLGKAQVKCGLMMGRFSGR